MYKFIDMNDIYMMIMEKKPSVQYMAILICFFYKCI